MKCDVAGIFISRAFSNAVADLERMRGHHPALCFPPSISEAKIAGDRPVKDAHGIENAAVPHFRVQVEENHAKGTISRR
jgi:hypothetical protein